METEFNNTLMLNIIKKRFGRLLLEIIITIVIIILYNPELL